MSHRWIHRARFAGFAALLFGGCASAGAPVVPAAAPPVSGSIVGEVRTPDGSPVPDALVAVFGEDVSHFLFTDPHWWAPSKHYEGLQAGTTGPNGQFRIEGLVLGGKYFVVATAQGWVGSEAIRGLVVDERRPVAVANPILRRGGRLKIVLRDPAGAPVTGATVTHFVAAERRPFATEILEGPEPGVFRLESLPPEPIYLTIEAEGWSERVLKFEPVGVEGKTEVLRLDPGVTLRGKVVDEEGRPVRDGWVSVDPEVWGWPSVQRQPVRAEPDGSFEVLHLPRGTYRVSGSAFSGGGSEDVLLAVPGEDVILRISGRPGQVQFQLLPPPGFAAPKVLYVGMGTTMNWRNGYFDIDVDSPGSGVIHLFPPGFAPMTLAYTVAASETVDLGDHVLDPGVTFEGLVVDPGGRPVEGAEAWHVLRWSQGDPRAVTGADGAFRLEHLARGTNRLHLSKSGFVDADVEVTGEGEGDRRFVLARGGLLRIRVTDAAGGPGAGACVYARAEGSPPTTDPWYGYTDVRGRVEARLPAGRWTIETWGAEPRIVTLTEAETSDVVLRLK